MKVLWFTNTPSCYKPKNTNGNRRGYNGGGWIASAEKAMSENKGIDLAVSFLLGGQPSKIEQDGVIYYPICPPDNTLWAKVKNKICLMMEDGNCHRTEMESWNYYIEHFRRIVEDFNPDVIHVWGSEGPFGLVWKTTDVPVILHIQGIITPYMNAYLPPFISWREYSNTSHNPIKVLSKKMERKQWVDRAYREREVYKGLRLVLGRTEWDCRVSHVLNPSLEYLHVDEILRDDFYRQSVRSIPSRLTIVTTISSPLYKGFDLVLKTANLLKYNLHLDFDWQCYGNINPKIVERITGISHNDVNVRIMGVVSSEQLREAELNSTLYFHSSYIDNSPNSLCEAQMLGLPIVSTNVGGVSSLVTDGIDGFMVPSNDPFQAACLIEELYRNSVKNVDMGLKASQKAKERHNQIRVREQIMEAYQKVVECKFNI